MLPPLASSDAIACATIFASDDEAAARLASVNAIEPAPLPLRAASALGLKASDEHE
jgi:hypothetical protein